MYEVDPEILQDFLTESGELLDTLDRDLVRLENMPQDEDLLNQVFRALHTIKGSASFMALTNLVAIAHAAEDALNAARRGDIVINKLIMDMLLDAVDLLKRQFDELRAGADLTAPEPSLVQGLQAVGAGKMPGEHGAPPRAEVQEIPEPPATTDSTPQDTDASDANSVLIVNELNLPENKADLLDFMVVDLEESLVELRAHLTHLRDEATRSDAVHEITVLCEALARSVEFYEFGQMSSLVSVLEIASARIEDLDESHIAQVLPRIEGVIALLENQTEGLRAGEARQWPIDTLCGRVADIVLGHDLDAESTLPEGATPEQALHCDGVELNVLQAPSAARAVEVDEATPTAEQSDAPTNSPTNPEPAAEVKSNKPAAVHPAKIEQTIRVEISRLEQLLNLVGELVLQKNRVSGLSRGIVQTSSVTQEMREAVTQVSGDLDRVTSDIQVAVMRARMQSLDRLFGKYPRLIRDLARKTGKNITLSIEGGDTEVDKSVIEELGDPLVHLLRNSVDHGVEPPEDRAATGKSEEGIIRLVASQEGGHVAVRVIDNGRGLDREKLLKKAIERGLTTEEEAPGLSDSEVYQFILTAGFSTAVEVSDISGRGVGMDVVRNNIEKLKGTIDIESTLGEGTTIIIKIPLTLAIMTAMMVGVGSELYAVPLTNILEIVRPEKDQLSTVNGRRVMRIRDSVLPLIDLSEMLELPETRRQESPFAVVVEQGNRSAGLMVSRLIGQQEVVIKPLDGVLSRSGGVSGATVCDDGGVSLIVDVSKLMQIAQETGLAAA